MTCLSFGIHISQISLSYGSMLFDKDKGKKCYVCKCVYKNIIIIIGSLF